MSSKYTQAVATRYHIYNSLFLNLPYTGIFRTGTLLPCSSRAARRGSRKAATPRSILKKFFSTLCPMLPRGAVQPAVQFHSICERQVVLFDSVEDAAFAEVNDLSGKGTIDALLLRASGGQCDGGASQETSTTSACAWC